MCKYLTEELLKRKDQLLTIKNQLKFILCDERFVPFNSADSTYGEYIKHGLFSGLEIPEENLFPIKVDSASVEECAQEYESRLRPLLNSNNGFDFLLLGCGPDGHTCSLFPGHDLFVNASKYADKIVVPISDSPKPPPQRVTLALSYITQSSYLLFLSGGASKDEIMKRIVTDKDLTLPCACVTPRPGSSGTLKWFVDKDAATLL